jgi:tetratricopeptide (TPR) repeat protein
MSDEKRFTLSQAHQKFAKSTFNSIWELLEKEDRSQEEDQEMLLAAYASLYHWTKVGTAIHYQRGSWMISKVHQSLGEAEPSLAWAFRCLEISETHSSEMEDFDLAYAQEALARAYALAGDQEKALYHWQQAANLGERIKDPEDKEIFEGDFRGGNWHQLQTN